MSCAAQKKPTRRLKKAVTSSVGLCAVQQRVFVTLKGVRLLREERHERDDVFERYGDTCADQPL